MENNLDGNKLLLESILSNIKESWRLCYKNDSVRIVAVVSGSEVDCENWSRRLDDIKSHIFNRDGSSLVLSIQEKLGDKKRQGNFLGTLLAYKNIKESSCVNGVSYRDVVTMIGMLFGRGERLSPITQCKGCRKPAVEIAPANKTIRGKQTALTSVEEALFYFTPVAKYLEKRGFRGVLNKWGDETEIPSIDLAGDVDEKRSMAEFDLIKLISIVEITEDLAKQKDWVIVDDNNNMIGQVSRNRRAVLLKQLQSFGIEPHADGKCYAGISLGPVAVSYDLLDIASEVFEDELKRDGVYFDFDPFLIMALAMNESDYGLWEEKVSEDKGLQGLILMVPDFFVKVQSVKRLFKERYKRDVNLKVLDLGKDVYWADIGQHSAMREKYFSLNDQGDRGIIARKIANIKGDRDGDGNIVEASELSSDVKLRNSVVINSRILGKGRIENCIIIDSIFEEVDMESAFALRSVRRGKTVLCKDSGLFDSLGLEDLAVNEKMRSVSLLTSSGKVDMEVCEDTDLRDIANTYDVPIYNNKLSFADAYEEMFGVSMEVLNERRALVVGQLGMITDKKSKFKSLRFGTSGLRDTVVDMTDMECYINSCGFIKYLFAIKDFDKGGRIAVSGDLRSSTPRIMKAVIKAVEDCGNEPVYCDKVPTPTLAYYAFGEGIPSIMVTGSHIPDDRNGIKFTKKCGEVLKDDEKGILKWVDIVRNEVYGIGPNESLFNDAGMFKDEVELSDLKVKREIIDEFVKRYLAVFSQDLLKGEKIVLYEHSAVGRDIVKSVFEGLGAEVIPLERSDKFIPVDTEKVSLEVRVLFKEWAKEYKPFVLITTDGDSDRPLIGDENGTIVPGDKLGAIAALFLSPDFAAIPISCNDAVVGALSDRGIKVEQTQIGSPYVVSAMNSELNLRPEAKVVSWESNGGFLLGSLWKIGEKELKALPTRDALLPLIAAIVLAKDNNCALSKLVESSLPTRYTHADVVNNTTKGCSDYTADIGKKIVKKFSPNNESIKQFDFEGEAVKVKGKHVVQQEENELCAIRSKLEAYFYKEIGLDKITSINVLDGVRIVFENSDVVHLRPSGNAPEFRVYSTSDSQERANEIVEEVKMIIPRMIGDVVGGVA